MQWSWKLGEIRCIGVYMHATFLILIGFGIATRRNGRTMTAENVREFLLIASALGERHKQKVAIRS